MKRILSIAIAGLILFGSLAGEAAAFKKFGQEDREANSEKIAR